MNKRSFLILLFLISTFASCTKDILISNSLIGEWELKTSINGMTGQPTEHPPGNGKLLVFTKNTYTIIADKQVHKSGIYSIVKAVSILDKKEHDRIVYDNEANSITEFFAIHDNQLNIWFDAYDAPSAVYIRKK